MRRRDFIRLLGGAAAAWPVAARAQQGERMRRIGVSCWSRQRTIRKCQRRVAAFQRGCSEWAGQRPQCADRHRWADGRCRSSDAEYAAELVALAPDVILAIGSPTAAAAARRLRTVPIVFVIVVDPVGAGFVASLARPGGNVTGFISFRISASAAKWLELLKEIAPSVTRAAVLRDPEIGARNRPVRGHPGAAPPSGVEVSPSTCASAGEIERAINGVRAARRMAA